MILISIADHEVAQLRRLCDEVFGERNYIGTIIWKNATDNNPSRIAVEHEYVIAYARNLSTTSPVWRSGISDIKDTILRVQEELLASYEDDAELQAAYSAWFRDNKSFLGPMNRYKYIDRDGIYIGSQSVHNPGKEGYRYDVIHPAAGLPCKEPLMGYRFPKETMDRLLSEGRILFGKDQTKIIELKVYAREFSDKLSSVIALDGRLGAYDLNALFPEARKVFTNPKPVELLMDLFSFTLNKDDIILDFFAGSCTSAEALLRLNARDGGRRNFVAVQLPEPVNPASEAGKEATNLGLNTIAAIGMERVRRAAGAIMKDDSTVGSTLDLGYRSYALSDTNFSKWRVTSDVEPDELEQHLLELRDSAEDDATQDALLTELLLKQGYSLTEDSSELDVAGLSLRSVGAGLLLAYLDEHMKPTLDQLREVIDREPTRFVILEDAFQGDDELKTNLSQLCKSKNVELWTA